jgi:hypothetical protein
LAGLLLEWLVAPGLSRLRHQGDNMKTLVYALAGVGVALALSAGPAGAQARPGGGGASHTGGASGAVATGGGGIRAGGGEPAMTRPAMDGAHTAVSRGASIATSSPAVATGATAAGYSPAPSSGSSAGVRSGSAGARWATNPVNGSSPVVRRLYGSAEDTAVPRGSRPGGATPFVGTYGHLTQPRQPALPTRGGKALPGTEPSPAGGGGGRHGGGGGGDIYWGYTPWIFAGLDFYNVLYADPYWLTGYWFPYEYGFDFDPAWDPALAPSAAYYDDREPGLGKLKLKVAPATADVMVDGYSVGIVDDFNGTFQKMELAAGPHHVEIAAPGYRSIAFDVRIEPNQTVTYRGELQPVSRQ